MTVGTLLFNDTITIVNRYLDPLTKLDKYNKTVLEGCQWTQKTTKTVVNGTIEIDDSIEVTIPYREGYLPPKQYAKIPNDEMPKYWTLNSENNLDIIVLGEIDGKVTSVADVKQQYDNVATISAVGDYTSVPYLKHWKVEGK